jgi:hypothetical protein
MIKNITVNTTIYYDASYSIVNMGIEPDVYNSNFVVIQKLAFVHMSFGFWSQCRKDSSRSSKFYGMFSHKFKLVSFYNYTGLLKTVKFDRK